MQVNKGIEDNSGWLESTVTHCSPATSSVDVIAISEIWNYHWLAHSLTGVGAIASKKNASTSRPSEPEECVSTVTHCNLCATLQKRMKRLNTDAMKNWTYKKELRRGQVNQRNVSQVSLEVWLTAAQQQFEMRQILILILSLILILYNSNLRNVSQVKVFFHRVCTWVCSEILVWV